MSVRIVGLQADIRIQDLPQAKQDSSHLLPSFPEWLDTLIQQNAVQLLTRR
jgi:hypothetical protein